MADGNPQPRRRKVPTQKEIETVRERHKAKRDVRGPDPTKRKLRCGPWTERPDGSFVCEKCGDIDVPGSGPMGY